MWLGGEEKFTNGISLNLQKDKINRFVPFRCGCKNLWLGGKTNSSTVSHSTSIKTTTLNKIKYKNKADGAADFLEKVVCGKTEDADEENKENMDLKCEYSNKKSCNCRKFKNKNGKNGLVMGGQRSTSPRSESRQSSRS